MSGTKVYSGQAPTSWAVLIGIDHYSSTPESNLKGCANDAVMMYNFLRTSLGVRDENIWLHIARDPASTTSVRDPPSTSPTKLNILSSLGQVTARASPGDFVLIHFSGHGDREPTMYPEKKSKSAQDELLCFIDDENLTDVEFGETLDSMVALPNQLVVLTTLDCCYSGGATRGGKDYILRCRSRKHPPVVIGQNANKFESDLGHLDDITMSRGMRDAALAQSWFYRIREYNVIAACQPYETAKEIPDTEGIWHGIMTSCLIRSLTSIGVQRKFKTYKDLHGILEAKVIQSLGGKKQQPMHLGEQNRVIFEAKKIHRDDSATYAHVQELQADRVVIDKGIALGVGLGDRYILHDPGKEHFDRKTLMAQGDDVVEVIITSVQDFCSEAKVYIAPRSSFSRDLKQVEVGWLATAVHRAEAVQALIYPCLNNSMGVAIENIRKNWQKFIDPAMPIHLVFMRNEDDASSVPSAKFSVQQDNLSSFLILDSEQKPFENLPKLPAHSADLPKRLMFLLRHLQKFLSVLEITTPSEGVQPAFRLMIEETADRGDDKNTVSSWKIRFENKHSSVLFIAALNLTPLHGIQLILPYKSGCGVPVEPKESIEEILDIKVPKYLAEAYGKSSFDMRDVVKVFITTEQIDFGDYELKNLEDTVPHSFRDIKPRNAKARVWCVESREIVTHCAGQPS